MSQAAKAIRFLETLTIPEGPKAGQPVKLAAFQKQFVKGALADGVNVAVLSIGRGNAKTALAAGIALGAVMGGSRLTSAWASCGACLTRCRVNSRSAGRPGWKSSFTATAEDT